MDRKAIAQNVVFGFAIVCGAIVLAMWGVKTPPTWLLMWEAAAFYLWRREVKYPR